jgi:poly(ADP-ribose) glycohydrolase ARH3
MMDEDKYVGCFLGLAIGDAYGAPFEGGPVERLLWKLIGRTRDGKIRYTDDTQMSIDLAGSFIKNNEVNQDHLAVAFSESYRWSRGYGPSAAWVLKKIRSGANWREVNRKKFKNGSYGNGAAMRAPILAMCFPESMERLGESVVKSSEITHAHPLAIEGAKLIALVTYAALQEWSTEAILEVLPGWCESNEYRAKVRFCVDSVRSLKEVQFKVLKKELGNGIAALQSCVTAIYFALTYRNKEHEAMLASVCKLGGDTDTIGAMAGAIWGAFNGRNALDSEKVQRIESSSQIIDLSKKLYAISSKAGYPRPNAVTD